MIRSIKFRLYPNREQAEWLTGQLRECCSLYNAALEERKGAWKTCRKTIGFYEQCKQLKTLRAQSLISIPNFSCAKEVLRRLDRAYSALFIRGYGFPRFKPAHRFDSMTFPAYGKGVKLNAGHLYIQGCSLIRINLHQSIEGKIKTLTVRREAGRWFVILIKEIESHPLPRSTSECGIDMGLISFVALSDGREIPAPHLFRNSQMKLRRAQRHLARCKRSSNRRKKAVLRVVRHYVKVKNQRADFHHKLSREIVNENQLIAVEDLKITRMVKGHFAKSIHDAGWGAFLAMLAYKAESAGRSFIAVNPRGTSQTCTCGARIPKTLKDRRHNCPACGLSAPRDIVSARVILQAGRACQALTKPETVCVV